MVASPSDLTLDGLNAFEAPYLIDKLLKEKMFTSREEAALLFQEVKRFLVLRQRNLGIVNIPMFSRRVDEVWHQLVLFTVEYCAFTKRFFGEYVHHTPNQGRENSLPDMTFEELRAAYESLFGPMPVDAWRDELAVTADTRVIRADFHSPIFVRIDQNGTHAELVWEWAEASRVLIRTGAQAKEALQFLVDTNVFYVREIPGPLGDVDRIALCRPLIVSRVLRVAP